MTKRTNKPPTAFTIRPMILLRPQVRIKESELFENLPDGIKESTAVDVPENTRALSGHGARVDVETDQEGNVSCISATSDIGLTAMIAKIGQQFGCNFDCAMLHMGFPEGPVPLGPLFQPAYELDPCIVVDGIPMAKRDFDQMVTPLDPTIH